MRHKTQMVTAAPASPSTDSDHTACPIGSYHSATDSDRHSQRQVNQKTFQRNLSQSIHPGPWKETTGLEIEGFPRQLYGNDCGIFMLMYALYTILDAPYDFTITDMPALRKWWCVMLMENFDLGRDI
ncbi:hypothetical protein CesoFtcFv8_007891 [Champsocephalus esox]|uniref:Ubiquitin-like protease family profile domain-containing protein n=1 Tax=Champsocephalus esox TaxID=159716 RepID=A0AAN8CHR2_9TELE|nr:hypothetical protein CesoFtcFv8_007891 [Champsocephalus esox]